jgi:hypothetical protein
MTTPVFPSYAKILVSGFSQQRESALLRTEMESGAPKQAKVRSRVMITRTCKIYLSSLADFQSFDTWFSTTLDEGALWFTFTDPVSLVATTARFVGGGYSAAPLMDKTTDWVITLKIETWG